MEVSKSKLSRRAAILLALLVVFLWATSWVLIKIGLDEIPPLTFAGLRYVIGFLCLLPLFLLRRGTRALRELPRSTWVKLIVLGLLFYSFTQGASFIALAHLPAVTVNLLWSFSSGFVALLGIRWLNERLTWLQWSGIGLALFGAVVYFFPVAFPAGSQIGILAAGLGVSANAVASILGRDLNRSGSLDPLAITAVSMGIGALILLGAGIYLQGLPRLSGTSWLIIGWLAVVNTALAFTLWNITLGTLTATESSVINGTMMIWIPILAVIFLAETLDLKQIMGLVMAGAGSLIVQVRVPARIQHASGSGGSDGSH